MTVKIDGSRSSVAWSMPRAMRAISIASRFRWRPSEYAWIGLSARVSSRMDGVEMADRRMDIDRLDRIAAHEVDDVERLAQPDEIVEVLLVADPPAAIEVGDVGWRRDRPERHPVAADAQVVGGVPGVERELRRRGPDALEHEVPIEADPRRPQARPRHRRPSAGPAPRDRGSPSRSRSRTSSEARWIDSSSSAETTSVGA